MNDAVLGLTRILRVREARRAAARLSLAEFVALAVAAEEAARFREEAAEATRINGRAMLARQRQEVFSAPFTGDVMRELRQSSDLVAARIAEARQAAAEARTDADEREAERSDAAQALLKLEGRCKGLEQKLRELRRQAVAKRDEKISDEFVVRLLHGVSA